MQLGGPGRAEAAGSFAAAFDGWWSRREQRRFERGAWSGCGGGMGRRGQPRRGGPTLELPERGVDAGPRMRTIGGHALR